MAALLDATRASQGEASINARIKRILRPLRPVLRPAWHRLRALAGRPVPKPAWPPLPEPTLADVLLRRRPSPIRAMTRAEFHDLRTRFAYYRPRGAYMSAAAWQVDELIARHHLRSALELGPHVRPIVTGADVMDLRASSDLEAAGRLIVHDATVTPWPIADRQYGLFVALQVFEHLHGAQREAFREVCRVARHAILSLPIDWVMDDPTDPHHQLSHERALSWFAPRVPTRVIEGNPGPKARMIYVFENLDRPAEG